MTTGNQVNFEPFKTRRVPCEGEVGDIVVLSPEGDEDTSKWGKATVWFCIKASRGERNAVWARVQFDGVASCGADVRDPPKDRPELYAG